MVHFTTPVARLVQGSCYKPNEKDANGAPLTTKSGPNAGQPRKEFYFAVAIPKTGESHWKDTPWGKPIYDEGVANWPQGQHAAPTFAWKITDGDSMVPNKKGKKPCETEGFPGHWVMRLSSGFAPQIFNADGTQQIVEWDAVKLGYFVQVAGKADSNNNESNPGMYMNHNMVALAAYGDEIRTGPDAASVGFGGGALPAGATAAPTTAGFNPAPAPVAAAPAPVAAAPAPVAATPPPNPAILNAPAPAAEPVMLPAAGGATYASMVAVGWTDELMRQHGYIA